MTPEAWRANVAGYLDAAGTLVREVDAVTRAANETKRVAVPNAVLEQLAEATVILSRLSQWMVSPHNTALEKRDG